MGFPVPEQPWFPQAPVLPVPEGRQVQVATVEELIRAVEQAQPGDVILLQDGTYYLPRYIEIQEDRVTLRSASGNRNTVVLDGSQSIHGELLGFRSCSGVTVAHITIQNIRWNGFKINSDFNVQNLTIYDCVIHNIWQRGVKSVRIPLENREQIRPKNCKVQYCLFYNDRPKRFSDDPSDTPQNFNGDYIGGIDTMFAKGWIISDNVFTGIKGRTGQGRGCIFMWHHAEDCIIERNIIIDCDFGIALGNSSGIGEGSSSIHGTNMVVRNNFITNTPETGILAAYTTNCKIINNTVHDPDNQLRRLIRIVHENDGLEVRNNLLSGTGVARETNDAIIFENNRIGDYTNYFVAPEKGNLYLKPEAEQAIDQGESHPDVTHDIDQMPREEPIDLGADEYGNVPEVSSIQEQVH
ncbi:MAG: right-handed parallel beta-helix repeat-containing protein [bacterium]